MDAFISWTGKDREVKNVLVEKLQAAGISCWDSDEFCTSDFSKDCISAIKRCGLFIVIVSDASMQTGYVKNEVIAARKQEEAGLLNILVYKITDAPYTDEFEFQLNHISFVTGNLVQRQESLRGDSGIDLLVARAQRLLQLRKDDNPEKPSTVKIPQVDGLKLTGGAGYFVENSRDDILNAIEEAFQKDNVIVLTEFVGFGKRSVIRKFLTLHPNQFPDAVLVDNPWGSLRSFLLFGLRFSNLNPAIFDTLEGDALIDAKFRQLEKLTEQTLLVIPDLDLTDDADLYRRLMGLKCSIILLTQSSADHFRDLLPVIRVGKMEDPYLTELFFHHYTRAFDGEKEELTPSLEDFFDQIGGHTKTVELTASVLNRELAVMPQQVPNFLSLHGERGMALKDRILSQLSNIFVIEKLTPGQTKALLIASCLAVPYISEQHFRQLLNACGVTDWQEVLELDSRRWLDLDEQNSTISIEPLVAQIVLQRFPGEYGALLPCFHYLEDAYLRQFGVLDSAVFVANNMTRMEHFFRLVGMDVLAELTEALKDSMLCNEPGRLPQALADFQSAYPEDAFSEQPEQEHSAETAEEFAYILQYFARTNFLPLAKLRASEIGGLFNNFSSGSIRILEQRSAEMDALSLDLEGLVGMSREELEHWLDTLRKCLPDEVDEDDLQAHFLFEVLAVTDALFRRDHHAMLLGVEHMLQRLEAMPQLLADTEYADLFSTAVIMMAGTYLNSGAYSAAQRLCERALAYPNNSIQQVMLRKLYINSLRGLDQYGEALYECLEKLLHLLDNHAAQIFENRQELLQEKQQWLLVYAQCLAQGQQLQEATEEYAKAFRLGLLLPNELVRVAREIAGQQIRSGEFEQARAFLEKYFSQERCDRLAAGCDPEHCATLQEIHDLISLDSQLQNDFASGAAPQEYISYYHAESRKNNSLLDRKYCTVADKAMEFDFSDLTDEELGEYALKLRERSRREDLLRLAPEAFALASEAGFRVLGYRHHYVQYMGAAAMADGKIAEILNGEGKTYTIVLTAFLQWLYRRQVFVVDESAYLTQRNHNWMQGVYRLLGMESLHIRNYRDLAKSKADVFYITLRELIFAYLSHELDLFSVRGALKLDVAIVDEIDTVLVDEAKERFHITSQEHDPGALLQHNRAWRLAEQLDPDGGYYTLDGYTVRLHPAIYPLMEKAFRVRWDDLDKLAYLNRLEQLVQTALLCRYCYREDKDYFIHKGIPVQEDKTRGVFTPFGATTEYFLCLQNGLDNSRSREAIAYRNRCCNAICVKELFRKFRTVCGTTATAVSFRKEFKEIYDLEYVAVPPHRPCIRVNEQSPLYTKMRYKDRAILETVTQKHEKGQPVLLITQSIAESEKYHRLLKRAGIPHRLLNARNAEEAAGILSTAGMPGSVLVANALVSRGADIRLGGNPERRTLQTLVEMGVDVTGLEDFLYRLPTPEQKESELYRKYYSILEENKRLAARQRQEVVAAGGLCVIGTGFFPELRNEQQTRGRSGRQGEVGESIVFRSVEDEGLRQMFSNAYMEMLLSTMDDMEEVESATLTAALRRAQKLIHDRCFADIRQVNNVSHSIEKYRKDFIGLRMDLSEGLVTLEELMEDWASHKAVLRQLTALQQGQERCESIALNYLWQHDESLKTAKGLRAGRVLREAFQKEMDRRFEDADMERLEPDLLRFIGKNILNAWQSYIETVYDTVGRVTMKQQALDQFLEQEKDRLLRQSIEQLINVRLKRP